MTGALHVLRSGPLDPIENMALDETLLRARSDSILRVYGWRPAGLSIGYFQRLEPFQNVPGDHRIVRRVTGGGAIYHAAEVTFALTIDADRLPRELGHQYDLVHSAVTDALAGVGVPTERYGRGALAPRPDAKWCFETPTCYDLCTTRGKIVGSAQRRIRQPRERVLHHGSIVLSAPSVTPDCGAIDEFTDPDSVEHELIDALVAKLARNLQLTPITNDNVGLDGISESAKQRVTERLARR